MSCQAEWWHFSHDADVGIGAKATTLNEVFEQAALAMTAVVTTAPIELSSRVDIRCEASDPELLLVDWLNALIFEMATRNVIFGRYEVSICNDILSASAFGEPVHRARHRPVVELKGATYTALSVRQDTEGHWEARCVVDV